MFQVRKPRGPWFRRGLLPGSVLNGLGLSSRLPWVLWEEGWQAGTLELSSGLTSEWDWSPHPDLTT